jgi:long-chain fatty acid transport protein
MRGNKNSAGSSNQRFALLCAGISLAALTCFFLTADARAGGLWMYESASSDMGMANAGRAASALDASTAFGNPAAMTVLDRSQMVTGVLGILPKTKFDVDSATHSGGGGGDAGGFSPSGSFAYVHRATERLRLGIFAGSYFGLGLDYDNKWSGRYYVQNASFLTMCVNPSIGYKLNDHWSIGGGVSLVGGKLSTDVAINTFIPGSSDGRLEYDDMALGFGYNLGILYELSSQTRFGLTYRSAVDLDFKDKPDIKDNGGLPGDLPGYGKRKLGIDTTIPQAVMFSVWHELTPKLALSANVGWQDWSNFGMPEISINGGIEDRSLTADLDYHDTYHLAIGAQYRIAPKWLLSAGIAYDTSPIKSSKKRSPMMPLDRQIRYATGLQHELTDDITIGGSFEFIDAGKSRVNQDGGLEKGSLKGEYDTNFITVLNLHIIWKF